ncbi:MAG: multifunctional CCA addition/repair protein [Pseudomonadota bacterium]
MQIFRVGGAVRDRLLKQKIRDIDYVVVGATIEEMLEQGYTAVGKDFPVFLHPITKEEYALARTEKKIAKGYKGFTFYTSIDITIEQDLYRRDLTINAIAEDETGQLIDPYSGVADLNNKILRHVSAAFAEDPVRILRTARFAARFAGLGFTIAEETNSLMKKMVRQGEADALVAERVWKEVESALLEPYPEVFIQALRQCGALKCLLPEIDNLFGVPQTEQWHPEIDTGIHTLMVLQQGVKIIQQQSKTLSRENQLAIQFAALVHDVGKAKTPKNQWPSHKKHEVNGIPIVKGICKRLKVPKHICNLALLVTEYHLLFHRMGELKKGTIIKLFNALDAFRRPQRLELFLLVCEADSRGRKAYEDIIPEQADLCRHYYQQACAVNVKDILALGYKNNEISEQLYLKRCQSLSKK